MEKIVIGIHGIGNKPPAKMLHQWWLESIYEGLSKYNNIAPHFNFEIVYVRIFFTNYRLIPKRMIEKK